MISVLLLTINILLYNFRKYINQSSLIFLAYYIKLSAAGVAQSVQRLVVSWAELRNPVENFIRPHPHRPQSPHCTSGAEVEYYQNQILNLLSVPASQFTGQPLPLQNHSLLKSYGCYFIFFMSFSRKLFGLREPFNLISAFFIQSKFRFHAFMLTHEKMQEAQFYEFCIEVFCIIS